MTPVLSAAWGAEALYEAQYRGLRLLQEHGFTPVVLPLVYPAGSGYSGDFRFLDGEGELWAVRADFTPLAARAFARPLLAQDTVVRVCYAGEVARRWPARLQGVAEFYQLGFEAFGARDEADAALELLLRLVCHLGVPAEQLSLGVSQAGVAEAMLLQLLEDSPDAELFELMTAKDVAALVERLGLATEGERMLRQALLDEGEGWVRFFGLEAIWERFCQLREVATAMGVKAHFEVAPSVAGTYYSGSIFALWGKAGKALLASGGEYSVECEGRRLSAVGSTLSLNRLLEENTC